jgi:hypothetical protein
MLFIPAFLLSRSGLKSLPGTLPKAEKYSGQVAWEKLRRILGKPPVWENREESPLDEKSGDKGEFTWVQWGNWPGTISSIRP